MKYAMLIYVDPDAPAEPDEARREAVSAEYYALSDEPACVSGAHLAPLEAATTVRVQEGEALTTDGPFAETKEVFSGFYIFDVDNLDAAIELAARVPAARMGGSVEIRPLMEAPDRSLVEG